MAVGSRSAIWAPFLGVCVGIRVAIPLAALAAEGRALPGLPAYDYGPLYGDANGFYATARELVADAGHGAVPLFVVLVLGIAAVVLAARRFRAPSWVVAVLAGAVLSAATVVLVFELQSVASPALGWPLVWAIPLAPLRVLDPGLDPDTAFVFGLALSLVAIAFTVVATALAGYWASGRRSVGLVAAALFTIWPFVPGLVVGSQGWENGTWNVDVGLHLYAEPLSTALVVGAVALLLRERPTDLALAVAGLALGFGTLVKLTNGLIAAGLVVVVAWSRGRRPAALLAGSTLVFAPILIAYWAQGYTATYDGAISSSNDVWALGHVREAWGDSLLFTPALVIPLLALMIVGAIVLPSRRSRATILVPIVLTVALYSFYKYTPLHPRFLYVVLPLALVLVACAVVGVATWARGSRWGSVSESKSRPAAH